MTCRPLERIRCRANRPSWKTCIKRDAAFAYRATSTGGFLESKARFTLFGNPDFIIKTLKLLKR
jgi:hypothetical protein